MDRLYKYRGINEHTKRIFTHSELFFSSVESLNDPFDGQLSPSDYVDGLNSDIAGILRESDKFIQYAASAKRKGVLSMSKRSDSIPMWTHYADEHRGICLGFNESLGDNFAPYSVYQSKSVSFLEKKCAKCAKSESECLVCNVAKVKDELKWDEHSRSWWPVRYLKSDELHPFSELCSRIESELKEYPDLAHNFLASIEIEKIEDLVKCNDWKYENEIRFVAPVSGVRKFAPSALEIVIFGIKASQQDRIMILELLENPEWKNVCVIDYRKAKRTIKLEANDILI